MSKASFNLKLIMFEITRVGRRWLIPTSLGIGLLLSSVAAADQLININEARKTELMSLDAISRAQAQAIIEHREKFGDFRSVYGLINVEGIGAGTVDALIGEVTIGDQ